KKIFRGELEMELNGVKENAKILVKDWLKDIFAEEVISEDENLIEKGLSSIKIMQTIFRYA
ncbi:TPA: hypothetical protein ACI0F2_000950, partial [Streptococcus agalactiae]